MAGRPLPFFFSKPIVAAIYYVIFGHLIFVGPSILCAGLLTAAPASFADETVALNQALAEASFATHPFPSADQVILLHEDSPGDTKTNFSATGGALRLGEKTYSRGIGSNSRCEIRVRLSRPAERFVADIGIDRNVEDSQPASAEFRVLVGGNGGMTESCG